MTVEENKDENRAQKEDIPESKYPYNEVYQTKGGVRMVVGNEEGKEALQIFHPSGSYMKYHPDGSFTTMNIGESKQYNKGGVTFTVDENNDVHIKGHSKLQVGGGSHIEVQGDAGIIVGGDVAMAALGDMGVKAKNVYMGARGNFNLNVEGDTKISTKGKTTFDTGSTMKIGAGAPITVQGTQLKLNPSDGGSGYEGSDA